MPRMRFEDDGPLGARMLHDALSRLARRLGASPPLNLWVRTAPRGAEHFSWRIDILPRLTHLAGLELGAGVNLNIVPPEAGRGGVAGRVKALVQRVSRASVSVDGDVVSEIGPGLLVLLGVGGTTQSATADWLADKVRALRIFPDADGRMNEPLGDRQVLCVSQFTLYGDARRGQPAELRGRGGARAGRGALRALLCAAGGGARRVRGDDGGRAGQRRAGHADGREPGQDTWIVPTIRLKLPARSVAARRIV